MRSSGRQLQSSSESQDIIPFITTSSSRKSRDRCTDQSLFPGVESHLLLVLSFIKADANGRNESQIDVRRHRDKVLGIGRGQQEEKQQTSTGTFQPPASPPGGKGTRKIKLTVCLSPHNSLTFNIFLCTSATGLPPSVIFALRSNQSPFKSNSTNAPSAAFLKCTLLLLVPSEKCPLTSKE
jgi:hypothetical protein